MAVYSEDKAGLRLVLCEGSTSSKAGVYAIKREESTLKTITGSFDEAVEETKRLAEELMTHPTAMGVRDALKEARDGV